MMIPGIPDGISLIMIKSVWENGTKAVGSLGEKLNDGIKKLIYQASQQYIKNYTERHGILKVLGMHKPVSLESIYTEVQFLDRQDIYRFDSIDNLEKAFRGSLRRSYGQKEKAKQEGLKTASEKQYLMVLGEPGAGKSTFLRRIGLEALKGKTDKFNHACIPVLIELKRFTNSDISIEKHIADEFRICGFPKPDESVHKLLEQGNLLILLDGLDEVPTNNLNAAIEKIQDFVDCYQKNRFIASCRTAAYRSGFRRFSDVAMTEFDDPQIQQFINNWFQSEEDQKVGTAQRCWKILQQSENISAKELAQTPLLLTFLCLVFDDSQNFPDNRSELYATALQILLKKWAAEKRIFREEIYQGLHTGLEEILLSEIAYKGFTADRLFFSKREVIQDIKDFLAGNLNAPQHFDGEAVLDAIAVQQGILVERAKDVYSFSHLTLQEYLTAQYIDDRRQVENLVAEHLVDKRWREVFLLVAGLMRGGADELLLLIEKAAQKYVSSPKLTALLNWAEQSTAGSEGDFKPVGKRALVNAFANAFANSNAYANTYSNAIANANAIANNYSNAYSNAIANAYSNAYAVANANSIANVIAYTYAIAQSIDYSRELQKLKIFKNVNFNALIARLEVLKTKVPDQKEPLELRLGFGDRLLQTYLQAFRLNQEMLDLYGQELKAWDNYLYANWLIIQCKEAAARVTPSTWAGIEERMLLPPTGL